MNAKVPLVPMKVLTPGLPTLDPPLIPPSTPADTIIPSGRKVSEAERGGENIPLIMDT